MGGPSSEYEVSLKTGRMILKSLDKKRYFVKSVLISKQGKWPIKPEFLKKNFDLVFIAMHGEYGEDGTVQKILERFKIPYTGSDSRASKLGMDKLKAAEIFKKAGLKVPAEADLKHFPVVIKPSDRGSSVGVSVVNSLEEMPAAIEEALKHSDCLVIQEFIRGRELTCGVLEINGRLIALPPTEIMPKGSRFFDFHAKYRQGASLEITPARLPAALLRRVQLTALKAHKAIGAKGFSRVDMILSDKPSPKIYVLEINTIPGMTKTSLLPQQAKAMGISFPKLLDIIIDGVLLNKV